MSPSMTVEFNPPQGARAALDLLRELEQIGQLVLREAAVELSGDSSTLLLEASSPTLAQILEALNRSDQFAVVAYDRSVAFVSYRLEGEATEESPVDEGLESYRPPGDPTTPPPDD
jgi:hypothetical protein